ncbi:hypothetical protein [Prevotella melaninogenica]|uniref:hypothetical protein n=1 Tax=Prevotella melaninogenica TaxID=28132 RepID=UPI00201207F5|nr:hypothetical protein [Prevotella melaninogenica]
MMETILFSFILILIIIWIMLGILYFYMRYVSPYGILIKKNKKGNEQTKENEATKEKDGQKGEGKEDQAEFVLIGKSRSISPIIPQVPSASSSENSEQNSNNFASQNSEKKEDMKEEDNEMDVDFEMERVDEDEVAREELILPIELTSDETEMSGQSVLARDLVRLQKWAKNCEEADEKEVKETIRQLQDSDLLDKYKENITKMQGEQTSLLEKIRKAEEQSEQQAMLFSQNSIPADSSASDTSSDNDDDKPLSYYL